MNLKAQTLFWIVSLFVTVILISYLGQVMTPFIAGFILAYVLNPAVEKLESVYVPRPIGTIIVLLAFASVILFIGLLLVPVLLPQVTRLLTSLPRYVEHVQTLAMTGVLSDWIGYVFGSSSGGTELRSTLSALSGDIVRWFGRLITGVLSTGQTLLSIGSLLVITPVVTFYLILDWRKIATTIETYLPREHKETINMLLIRMDMAIGGFIRGQLLVICSLSLFYSLGLSLVGLNFSVVIGLLVGILSFIPYVGSMIGFFISVFVAIVQFWPDWTSVATVVLIFFVGQFLEGYVLSPKLVGERVGLHPVWLMFALFACGFQFGFVGLLIAVPLSAVVAVLIRFGLEQYLLSSFFHGVGSASRRKEE